MKIAILRSKNRTCLGGQFKVGFIMMKQDYCSDFELKTIPK